MSFVILCTHQHFIQLEGKYINPFIRAIHPVRPMFFFIFLVVGVLTFTIGINSRGNLGIIAFIGLGIGAFLLLCFLKNVWLSIHSGELSVWYNELTKKKRIIAVLVALFCCAFPVIGWIFICAWLLPLLVYLEYQRP
jgi:hypothetical protein